MTPEDLDTLKEHIESVIKQTVNGKIDRIDRKIDEHNTKHEADMVEVRGHIEETKPILKAYDGVSTVGESIKWVAGVGTAVGVLWIMLKSFFTPQ